MQKLTLGKRTKAAIKSAEVRARLHAAAAEGQQHAVDRVQQSQEADRRRAAAHRLQLAVVNALRKARCATEAAESQQRSLLLLGHIDDGHLPHERPAKLAADDVEEVCSRLRKPQRAARCVAFAVLFEHDRRVGVSHSELIDLG